MPKTVAERIEYGFETIEDAVEMLVIIYNTIPKSDLDSAPISFTAGRLCGVLEMLLTYVDETEDIDVEALMGAINMELSSTVAVLDDEEPKVH